MRCIGLTLALAGSLTWQPLAAAPTPAPADFARFAGSLVERTYRSDMPGVAVLVMRGDEVLYRGARGEADVPGDVPLEPGDRFRIGSVTKQITAAGLLTLVDAGKVSLDDPLSKYLPAYPGGAGITIEQLLNHTSGITEFTQVPGWAARQSRRDVTTAQLVDYFKHQAPDFAPGEDWSYSNSGYVLVGAVIEAASGQAWHRYLDQALFQPLGMQDTGYAADPAIVARQVNGYVTDGEILVPAPPASMTQPHAAGALVSTVDDLARFARALHEGRVLEPATYARMVTPAGRAKDRGNGYGYGVWVGAVRGAPALQHSGGIPGFTSHLLHLPGPGLTVAVLQNCETPDSVLQPDGLARRLAAAALGKPYQPVTPVVVDAAVLRQYEGIYRVDPHATRTLRLVDGRLTAERTGGQRFVLTATADDTFVYPDDFSRLQLLRDASGNVTAMRFWPDGEGEGLIAPLTDQGLPIDMTHPVEELDRLAGPYTVHGLVVVATIAMFFAARTWRRRKRRSGAGVSSQRVRG